MPKCKCLNASNYVSKKFEAGSAPQIGSFVDAGYLKELNQTFDSAAVMLHLGGMENVLSKRAQADS